MKKPKEKLYGILQRHVPENAVQYCLDLWSAKPFHFRVTRSRNSKLGDYKFNPITGDHSISVNVDLNPFSFLITYIHEVAHLLTTERNGRKVLPHGVEWQSNFQELMEPVLNELIFPADILKPLVRHMKKPKASTYSDARLLMQLRNYDQQHAHLIPLEMLEEGDVFIFKNELYRKIQLRRTRVLCSHAHSSRRFLISKLALVQAIKPEQQF